MTIPAVSRRNIAIRLAATVWISSARTTRGLAIKLEDAGPRAHRETHRAPGAPPRGAHDADMRGVESWAGQGRRDHDVDSLGEAQPDLPRGSLEQELGLGRLTGAEIDEDVQALQARGHGGGDAIERGKRTRRDAQRVSSGR